MTFLDFVPVELEGMSIITAIFFFFAGVGACYFHTLIRREFGYIYNTLDEHKKEIDELQDNMGSIRTDIALLLQSVTRIEKSLERR